MSAAEQILAAIPGLDPERLKAALNKVNKTYVYDVREYEEYAAQISHGLYATLEGAIARGKEVISKQFEWRDKPQPPEISVIDAFDEGDKLLLVGQWTRESFDEWGKGEDGFYWWYSQPFNHSGVVAILRSEVHA